MAGNVKAAPVLQGPATPNTPLASVLLKAAHTEDNPREEAWVYAAWCAGTFGFKFVRSLDDMTQPLTIAELVSSGFPRYMYTYRLIKAHQEGESPLNYDPSSPPVPVV